MNQRNIAKASTPSSASPTVQNLPQSSSLQTKLYKGSIDCGIQVNEIATISMEPIMTQDFCFPFQTVRNEGFSALYKGFIPTWFRMGPWNIIFFITYEQLKQFY